MTVGVGRGQRGTGQVPFAHDLRYGAAAQPKALIRVQKLI